MQVIKKLCDVLVIGSGAAGLRAAIEFSDNGVDVQVVGKCKKADAHTILATGGINAALANMDSKDSWQLHAADTIHDGADINDPVAVKILAKESPAAVKELADWGCPFHREKDGRISQRFFGAATYRRACFVGDITGKAILETLVKQATKRKLRFDSQVYIFALLHRMNKVNGALGLNMKTGEIIVYHAKVVVLATGGHSRMFSRSSSRFWENNGDGVYLGFKLGAHCMDMEMFQFHPTGMIYPKIADGVLVTEAVRGEGGILTNVKGERFMKRYDPDRMELSARDVVARAIYMEVKAGRGTKRGGVWLDISHRPKRYILKRLPKMYSQFKKFAGIDISKRKMEIAPTAHYSMGGLRINHKKGKTSITNLYAIGEVTSGVHGGNRLGGNSLAECVVFGKRTAQQIIKVLPKKKDLPLDDLLIQHEASLLIKSFGKKGKDPILVKKQLQELMWTHGGVVRTEEELRLGLEKLENFKFMKLHIPYHLKMNESLIAALDVRNMIPVCEMILKCALFRRESRGAHYRGDFTKTLRRWKKNLVCYQKGTKLVIKKRRIKIIPREIKRLMRHRKKRSTRLLE